MLGWSVDMLGWSVDMLGWSVDMRGWSVDMRGWSVDMREQLVCFSTCCTRMRNDNIFASHPGTEDIQ